jgi:phosphoribosyl 1,2-cyclic phosphodiesterase
MRFITLSSSSSGNGYILLSQSGEVLVIEAGVSLMEVKKALGFDLSKITGCIVSHLHNDHSGKISEYLQSGIICYMNFQTSQHKGPHHNIKVIESKRTYWIGNFKVTPFLLKHDVENYGYLIWHDEMGLCPFITDTHYCTYTFPGMNNILVECNYSDAIVDEKLLRGTANLYVRNRVIQSHMELQTTIDFLKANDLSKVNNIVLLHLSEGNSNAKEFKQSIQDLTGKQVYIAEPGLNIEFGKTSF